MWAPALFGLTPRTTVGSASASSTPRGGGAPGPVVAYARPAEAVALEELASHVDTPRGRAPRVVARETEEGDMSEVSHEVEVTVEEAGAHGRDMSVLELASSFYAVETTVVTASPADETVTSTNERVSEASSVSIPERVVSESVSEEAGEGGAPEEKRRSRVRLV